MRSEPVVVPGVAGPVVVESNLMSGRLSLSVRGRAVPRTGRGRFALPAVGGGVVEGRVRGGLFDTYPRLVVNGVTHRTGPQAAVWLQLLALLPIGLVGVGGAVGGMIGALGVIVNLAVVRAPSVPAAVKPVLVLAITGAAVGVWYVLARVIFAAT